VQCVSSGADAAVRAWQVDALPLTHFLLALIHICVDTDTFINDLFGEINGHTWYNFSFYVFLPTHSSLRAFVVWLSDVVGCFLYPDGHSGMQLCPSPAKMCPYKQEHRYDPGVL